MTCVRCMCEHSGPHSNSFLWAGLPLNAGGVNIRSRPVLRVEIPLISPIECRIIRFAHFFLNFTQLRICSTSPIPQFLHFGSSADGDWSGVPFSGNDRVNLYLLYNRVKYVSRSVETRITYREHMIERMVIAGIRLTFKSWPCFSPTLRASDHLPAALVWRLSEQSRVKENEMPELGGCSAWPCAHQDAPNVDRAKSFQCYHRSKFRTGPHTCTHPRIHIHIHTKTHPHPPTHPPTHTHTHTGHMGATMPSRRSGCGTR